jgi:hypothetical protein
MSSRLEFGVWGRGPVAKRAWDGVEWCGVGVGVGKSVFGWRVYMKVSGEDAGWEKEGKLKHRNILFLSAANSRQAAPEPRPNNGTRFYAWSARGYCSG